METARARARDHLRRPRFPIIIAPVDPRPVMAMSRRSARGFVTGREWFGFGE